MRIRELRDVYLGQDIYIVGSGPSINYFPMDTLKDKVCMSLNDSYKKSGYITPIALMHHQHYAHSGPSVDYDYHNNFKNIRYPIVKAFGRDKAEIVDWDNEYFYYFDWSHDIDEIWEQSKETDKLYYVAEGCSLHAALQLCWIMGAKNIFTIGCDSRTMGGSHYAAYDKNGFREDEVLKRGQERNYDAYVYGELIIAEFLKRKGINVFGLSNIVGYHMVDYQHEFLSGNIDINEIIDKSLELKE